MGVPQYRLERSAINATEGDSTSAPPHHRTV